MRVRCSGLDDACFGAWSIRHGNNAAQSTASDTGQVSIGTVCTLTAVPRFIQPTLCGNGKMSIIFMAG